MSLVNIQSVHSRSLQILERLEPGAGVELLSYKRNRSVAVTVLPDRCFQVREHGYVEQEMAVAEEELPRLLKTLIKREFPRSRKVRLLKYADPEELERQRKII